VTLPYLQALTDRRPMDLDEVLRAVLDEVAQRLDAERATLFLVDHARGELVTRVAHLPELSEIRLKMGQGIAGWVAQTGEVVRVPDSGADPRFEQRVDLQTGFKTRTLLAVPIRFADGAAESAPAGVLQVLNRRSGAFEREQVEQLEALAAEVASLLAETSLRSQLTPGARSPLDFRFNHIVGDSPVMREVYDRTARAAPTDVSVLILGESGVGKERIAHALHWSSSRRDAPFVKVDCAALPASLIENELFGHERGAFTGADRATQGQVAAAEGGTLFLDEVGELPLGVQGKLLRLIQDRTYLRVGAARPSTANLRFVCATHRNLKAEVERGAFRSDLFYRLQIITITVPSLRERGAYDLDRLTDHFLYEARKRHRRAELRLSAGARQRLHAHDWPGNVRELEACIESAVVLSVGPAIEAADLALPRVIGEVVAGSDAGASVDRGALFRSPLVTLEALEHAYVRHVVEACGGNRSAASRLLGIGRNTLLRKLGLVPDEPERGGGTR